MSVHGAQALRAAYPESDLERLKGRSGGGLEAEKARLKEAVEQFEALFTYQLLKTMRETIPEGGLAKDAPLANSGGKEIFTQMFDLEIARKMGGQGQTSIADMLYRSMEKAVEAQYGERSERMELKPLRGPDHEAIPILREDSVPLSESGDLPLPIQQPQQFRPISGALPGEPDSIIDRFGSIIRSAAKETGVDPEVIYSVIKHESAGNPTAVSSKGAKGLMQLMDVTAREMEVSSPFDPRQNILGGARYLKKMIDRYGDVKTALAAYNAGPGSVDRHNGIPPYRETQDYVAKVSDTIRTVAGRFR